MQRYDHLMKRNDGLRKFRGNGKKENSTDMMFRLLFDPHKNA